MRWITTVLALILLFVAVGCEETADTRQAEATKALMAEAEAQVGMPAIVNFQERKLAKYIIEQCDRENLVCYAYVVNLQGELIFIGKCIGYGLPYSVQYTNPERPLHAASGYTTIPQPDPSGLFKPDGLSATWLMMIDGTGKARPVYIEPQIIVSPFPLR